jgi:hypothetical protein
MKKFILLTAAIISSILCYSQKASLSDFLNQDLKQIMQDRIDSLAYQLTDANLQLEAKIVELDGLDRHVSQITNFILLLHKLENNLPLSKEDSTFASINNPPSPEQPIVMEQNAFDLITNNDPSLMESYPKLKQWVAEKKLTFLPDGDYYHRPQKASAPAIEMPSLSATGPKQMIADVWLKYINDLCSGWAEDMVNEYKKREKDKVRDNNLDKIIELRQKFSFFILQNYGPILQ